jgi:hypothetical protein
MAYVAPHLALIGRASNVVLGTAPSNALYFDRAITGVCSLNGKYSVLICAAAGEW